MKFPRGLHDLPPIYASFLTEVRSELERHGFNAGLIQLPNESWGEQYQYGMEVWEGQNHLANVFVYGNQLMLRGHNHNEQDFDLKDPHSLEQFIAAMNDTPKFAVIGGGN